MTRESDELHKLEERTSLQEKEEAYYKKLAELYDLDSCIEWIHKNNFEKVCLQFPDSLLIDSVDIAAYIENKISRKVYILGDTTYGSCCVDEVAVNHVNGNCVIHFGHACLSPVSIPVFYVFLKKPLDVNKFLDGIESYETLQKPVLILYDVAYHHCTEKLRHEVSKRISLTKAVCVPDLVLSDQKLESKVCSVWCSLKLTDEKQHKIESLQRTYCPPPAGQFNTIVYLGTASPNLYNFIYLFSSCKTLCYEDSSRELKEICLGCTLKQLSYLTERLKSAKTIGIVVATLGVEGYKEAVDHAKQLCTQAGKKSYIISVGKPTPSKLANFSEMDIFVIISCPETDFGDKKEYLRPMVGLYELDLALNKSRPWGSGYTRDFRDVIKGGKDYFPSFPESSSEETIISDHNHDDSSLQIIPSYVLHQLVESPDQQSNKWKGLDKNLGEDKPSRLTEGRKGGPQSSYSSEPHQN